MDRPRRSYDRRTNGSGRDRDSGGGGGSRWRSDVDDSLPPSEYDLLSEEERMEEARKINEGSICYVHQEFPELLIHKKGLGLI